MKTHIAEIQNIDMKCIVGQVLSFLSYSVLDLNAFERQNKAEGLGMVTEEGSSK